MITVTWRCYFAMLLCVRFNNFSCFTRQCWWLSKKFPFNIVYRRCFGRQMDVSTILRTSKRDKVDECHFQSCFGLHMVVSKIISNPCFVFFRRLFRLYIFYRPTLFWTSGGHFQQYTSPCAFTMLVWLTL